MVKYYGRARQRIGSVNTNQIGLKMSGCPSKVGRQGYLNRYIASRVQCNQKYCGPVYYHGQLWKWNSGRCVAKAPRGQSFNSGVGTKVGNPRFACNKNCTVNPDYDDAIKRLREYFKNNSPGEYLILVGRKETLKGDDVEHPELFQPIKHYYPGTQEYANLPLYAKQAVDLINSVGYKAPLKKGGTPVPHVVGTATFLEQHDLHQKGYGNILKFGPQTTVFAYGNAVISITGILGCAANIWWKAVVYDSCVGSASLLAPEAVPPALIACASPLGTAVIVCVVAIVNAMFGTAF